VNDDHVSVVGQQPLLHRVQRAQQQTQRRAVVIGEAAPRHDLVVELGVIVLPLDGQIEHAIVIAMILVEQRHNVFVSATPNAGESARAEREKTFGSVALHCWLARLCGRYRRSNFGTSTRRCRLPPGTTSLCQRTRAKRESEKNTADKRARTQTHAFESNATNIAQQRRRHSSERKACRNNLAAPLPMILSVT
jgi:hypothetical protein